MRETHCTCYTPAPNGPEYVEMADGTVVEVARSAGIGMLCCPLHPAPDMEARPERETVAWWRRMLLRLAGYEWILNEVDW